METVTHYDTLELHPDASQSDIKQAYRRLAKLFHPDSQQETASHDRIASINAAYEILGDPTRRRHYDARILGAAPSRSYATVSSTPTRRHASSEGRDLDAQVQVWLKQVYTPVNRALRHVINQLNDELRQLSADPFDDDLLEDFQSYLDDCREKVEQAQRCFRSAPNPSTMAGAASSLYHCLDQVGDGVDELERFISCYDEHYLHTGQELFRIAHKLREDAQAAMQSIF